MFFALAAVFLWRNFARKTNFTDRISDTTKQGSKTFPGFITNTAETSIDLDLLLSGGPGKDGIPAINQPKFASISDAKVDDEVLGILVEFEGEKRYYPFNIIVWHEVVNDSIKDTHYAVTFCPLCGSAIVFNRRVDSQVLQFGVSGFLFESNLVMYDTATESFWSQSKGEAIVGDFLGTKLEVLPLQQITFAELKEKHPEAIVLSRDTGHIRSYGLNPYGGYGNSEDILFPVSVTDKRFSAKEIMYVIPLAEKSVAFPQLKLKEGKAETFELDGSTLEAIREGDEIDVKRSGEVLPGYFEMWFSWATQHQDDGVVWEI